VVEAPYSSRADCTSMLSIYKVFEPLHMLWMAIQHHDKPVLVTQVDLDFDIRAEIQGLAGSHLGFESCHSCAVVEAPYPSQAHCTSMLSIYKVFEPLHMLWMAIQHHDKPDMVTQVDLDFDIWAEIQGWFTSGL
jgi:hypothetical protein